jgi:hypothetical protein
MTRSRFVRRIAQASAAALFVSMAATAPALAQEDQPWFSAHVTDDQVFGAGFGGPVTVTIATPGEDPRTFSDNITYEDGGFLLLLDPSEPNGPVDVQPGQTVTVTGPSGTKTLSVADVHITSYDLAANTLAGTVNAPTGTVAVWADHPGANGWTSTDVVDGQWAVDFDLADPPYDLRVLDNAGVAFNDDDQDSTVVEQTLAVPRFAASMELQEVVGTGWTYGTNVTLTVQRASSVILTRTVAVLPEGEGYGGHLQAGMNGNVYVDLTGGPTFIQPGDLLTLSDDVTTKTQLLPALSAALPDYATDTISGTTTAPVPADSFLTVIPDATSDPNSAVPVPSAASWAVDVSGDYDVTETSLPVVQQSDVDGDVTESQAPQPAIYVDPAANRVWAPDFAAGTVTLTISRGGVQRVSATLSTANVLTKGSYNLDMWTQPTAGLPRPTMVLYDGFDVVAGDQITVSDGVSSRTITVAALTVDSVNARTDVLTGTASPDGAGVVTLHLGDGEGGYWGYYADVSAGAWSYWFEPGVPPNPPDGLAPGMTGQAMIGATIVRWTVPASVSFEKPIASPPSYNAVRAGNAVQLRFRLGGDLGLEIFAAGSPTSQLLPSGTPEATLTARSGLTLKNGVYTYVWATDRAWKGTSRELVMTFTDGSTAVANFTFR